MVVGNTKGAWSEADSEQVGLSLIITNAMENLSDKHVVFKIYGMNYNPDALDKIINQSTYQRFHESVEIGTGYH